MFTAVICLCGWMQRSLQGWGECSMAQPGHCSPTAVLDWKFLGKAQDDTEKKNSYPWSHTLIMALWVYLTWGFDIYSQTYALLFFIIVDVYFSHPLHPIPETARIYDKHKVRLMYFLCKIRRVWHLWVSRAHNSVCCWATENANPSVFNFNSDWVSTWVGEEFSSFIPRSCWTQRFPLLYRRWHWKYRNEV